MCLMTWVHLWARETPWFDFSFGKFINLRRTLISLPFNKMICKWDLIRKCEIWITSGTEPSPLPTHGADTSVLRRKNTEFLCYSRNSELCSQLDHFKDPNGTHICSWCLHIRNFSLHNFALKNDGMNSTLIKCRGNTNLLWKAPPIHLLAAKVCRY